MKDGDLISKSRLILHLSKGPELVSWVWNHST